jgi:hypothetical protein
MGSPVVWLADSARSKVFASHYNRSLPVPFYESPHSCGKRVIKKERSEKSMSTKWRIKISKQEENFISIKQINH